MRKDRRFQRAIFIFTYIIAIVMCQLPTHAAPRKKPTVDLTANPTTVASGGSTTLTWTSTNATSCTASNGWSGTKATSGSQTLTGLTANATYTLTCTGRFGSTAASATVTVAGSPPDTTPPSVPGNLSASAVSSSEIDLTWTASTDDVGVTGYKVYRGGAQVGTSATASFADTGLTAATQYTYTVAAYDAAGNLSPVSSPASATTQSGGGGGGIIPADRLATANWRNAGMISKGGIPNRTTICATLNPGDGSTDDSGRIQSAVDACPANQVVFLNAGTYVVNNLILIHSSISLRGAGAGQTILKKTNGARPRTSTVEPGTNGILTPVDPSTYTWEQEPVIIVGPSRWPGPDNTGSQNLTVDGAPGATSVTVADATGYAAGQFVLLDEHSGASWQPVPTGFGCSNSVSPTPCPPFVWQSDRVSCNMHYPTQKYQDDSQNADASGPYDTTPGTPPAAMSWFMRTDRPTNEIKEIVSVSGNTITFSSPLTIGYRVSHQAQLTQYIRSVDGINHPSLQVQNAGIENLSTLGGADGSIRFESAAYSWAKGVEVTQWSGEGIAIEDSFRLEIRDCFIHTGSWPTPGGGGYALSSAMGSSELLFENNISIDVNKVMVFRASGTGSVVAYNYTDDGWISYNTDWIESGINGSHMAGPHHILFEGNYSFNADSDYTHGNAIYMTFFRNQLAGVRRDFPNDVNNNNRTVGFGYGAWWDSVVGNVLGRPGQMSGYTYTDPALSCDANGDNCSSSAAGWTLKAVWTYGYDSGHWGMYADPKVVSTIIRDGNFDYLTNSVHWHNTPGGFTIPSSMYLDAKPAFFGTCTWPWVDATGPTKTAILPAKARYDAGTPNVVKNCGS